MDNKQFMQFKKKHTLVSKKFKAGMITACALLGAGVITTGTLYGISLVNKKDGGGSSEELLEKIAGLEKQIVTKEAKIKELETKGEEYKGQIDQLKKDIEEKKVELEKIKAELEEAKAEASKYTVMFVDKDFKNKGTFKIAKDTTFEDAKLSSEVPDPTSGYHWVDFDATKTTFSTHTLIHEINETLLLEGPIVIKDWENPAWLSKDQITNVIPVDSTIKIYYTLDQAAGYHSMAINDGFYQTLPGIPATIELNESTSNPYEFTFTSEIKSQCVETTSEDGNLLIFGHGFIIDKITFK